MEGASCYARRMTLKQQIYELVEELPDDSPLLAEVRETLRMKHAIGEAMEDVHVEGCIFSTKEFTAKAAGAMAAQRSHLGS